MTREQILPGDPDEVFGFFADAFNLEAITPPWLRFRVLTQGPVHMAPGALIQYRLALHRIPIRWLTRIETWVAGERFVDVQVRGPYRLWHHTHTLRRTTAARSSATGCATRCRSARSATWPTGCSCAATSSGSSTSARSRWRECSGPLPGRFRKVK